MTPFHHTPCKHTLSPCYSSKQRAITTLTFIYCNITFAMVFNYEIMNDNMRKISLSVAITSTRVTKCVAGRWLQRTTEVFINCLMKQWNRQMQVYLGLLQRFVFHVTAPIYLHRRHYLTSFKVLHVILFPTSNQGVNASMTNVPVGFVCRWVSMTSSQYTTTNTCLVFSNSALADALDHQPLFTEHSDVTAWNGAVDDEGTWRGQREDKKKTGQGPFIM